MVRTTVHAFVRILSFFTSLMAMPVTISPWKISIVSQVAYDYLFNSDALSMSCFNMTYVMYLKLGAFSNKRVYCHQSQSFWAFFPCKKCKK